MLPFRFRFWLWFADNVSGRLAESAAPGNQTSSPEGPPPPLGTTPPAALAYAAAQGQRKAAWRLIQHIAEDNPEAIAAVACYPQGRLLGLFLEWLALGTWAGKSMRLPAEINLPHARTKVRTLFLPGPGAPQRVVKDVLCDGLRHPRSEVRETAAHLLGLLEDPSAEPDLIAALRDPSSAVCVQAAKALGRLRTPQAASALVNALSFHDEALASQARVALVQLGVSVEPLLMQAAHSPDAWVRWHALRALGEFHDARCMPALVEALADNDYAVAWMAARELAKMGMPVVEPILRLLLRVSATPQLMETAAYVLRAQRNPQLKSVLEPVIRSMHDVDYRVAMPLEVGRALKSLARSGVGKA
jgi:hypothetical protein